MKQIRYAVLLTCVTILAALLTACSLAEDVTPPPGYQGPTTAPQAVSSGPVAPSAAPDLTQGAAIYAQKCAPCHGDAGLGNGPQAAQLPNPPAPIGSAEMARTVKPSDWFTVVSQGRLDRMMPGFNQSLTAQQIWDVLAYVSTLSNPASDVQQGSQIFQAQCAGCHGVQGKGGSAQSVGDLSDPSWQASQAGSDIFQTITSGKGQMPGFAAKLTDTQRWQLVSYLRSLGVQSQPLASAGTPASSTQQTTTETTQASAPGVSVVNPQGTPLASTPGTTASVAGSVTGQIKNGSGAQVPGGLVVTLHGFDGMQETLTLTTTAGQDGKYTFPRVEVPSGRMFRTSVSYKSTVFNSDVVQGQAGPQVADLPLIIYEPTTDASALVVDRMHIFFDFSTSGIVQVVQLYVISNPTNQAVVSTAPGQPILKFALPTGAANLQFQSGELGGRFVSTADGFGDTQSVPPGADQDQILFAYTLPYDNKANITLPITMPIKAAVIMVPKVGVEANGAQLQDGGDQDVQGVTYHLYNTDNLAAGSKLSLSLSGTPSAQTSLVSGGSLVTLEIGLLAFALAVGLATLYLVRMQRRLPRIQPTHAAAGTDEPGREPDDPDGLIDAIIALDDQYQAGKLPEAAYRERRAELKAHLGELIK